MTSRSPTRRREGFSWLLSDQGLEDTGIGMGSTLIGAHVDATIADTNSTTASKAAVIHLFVCPRRFIIHAKPLVDLNHGRSHEPPIDIAAFITR